MNKKTKRIIEIRKLIDSQAISSQEEMLFKLKQMGIDITQSTLSRDLKFINAAKLPHPEKGYIYILPDSIVAKPQQAGTSSVITDNITDIDFSGNMCVIKTKPGYANAVTVLIDNNNFPQLLGTIAGEDTIFLVMKENTDRNMLLQSLQVIHPDMHSFYKDNR